MSASSSGSIELEAPAKVNLGLRIVGRRPDGYHLLESLFVPIDWSDRIRLRVRRGSEPRVQLELRGVGDSPAVPAGAENLAARAASAFVEASGLALEVEIELDKRLPAAAGLGGGSSDAAAVLRGLADLEPAALARARLPELALRLGADVPFFLDPRPALVRGIGERIEPVRGLPPLCLLLANPGVSLATAAVYHAWDEARGALTPPEPGSTMLALSRLLTVLRTRTGEGNGAGLESAAGDEAAALLELLLHNDLEPSACGLCPEIAPLQEQIRELGALATGLSGSGASVYGVFASQDAARHACRRLEGFLGMREAGKASGGWARVVVTLGEGGGT